MINKDLNEIKINDCHHFLSQDLEEINIISQDGNDYKVLYKEKLYSIKILHRSNDGKNHSVKINGYTLHSENQDEVDQLVNKLGFNSSARHEMKEVLAPMPGLVLSVMVNEGDTVSKGDNLFILEAMKMENIIKSAGDGTITKIKIKKGDKVDKGQILASF